MLIDWFTVGAQMLNFVILLIMMKRLLYGPLLDAIDAREQRIAAQLATATDRAAEAQRFRDEFERKTNELETACTAQLEQAKAAAQIERQRLIEEARSTAHDLLSRRQQELLNDASSLDAAVASRAQQEVFAIARQALRDLATTSLEERMTDAFIRQIAQLDETSKTRLLSAMRSTTTSTRLRSAFELPETQRAKLKQAVNAAFSTQLQLSFETEPAVISGIELVADGQKLAWSIANYLTSLERGVHDLVAQHAEAERTKLTPPTPKVVHEPTAQ